MNKNGEIIVIEDDVDDQEMFTDIFQKIKINNKVLFFGNGEEALEYLQRPGIEPFLILSDRSIFRSSIAFSTCWICLAHIFIVSMENPFKKLRLNLCC